MQKMLLPLLISLLQSKPVQDKLAEWKTELFDWLKAEFEQHRAEVMAEIKSWLPIIVKTVITSMAQSAGQLVVDTEHRVTDIIPTKIDDRIVDTITTNVFDRLRDITGIQFR